MINYWLSGKGDLYLSHEDNILEFQFAALSFRHPSRNQYKYQLESFSDNWIELGTTHSVTFTNLDPGAYTLHVTGSNDYGIWNEAGCSLEIVITPPWYWNFWSKCIYLLLSVVFIYSLYRFQLNRKLAIAEAYRLKELDAIKTRLYTNITHEFRTPLTIIQGMAEQEIEQEGHLPPEKAFENAQMIKRNSDRLLRLVTQMLDLHKLESGSMTLNRVNGDLIAYR